MFSGLAVSPPSESAPTIARLPRVVPRSLFSRALLIVIMPLVILQAVLAYVFYERHWDSVTRWLAVGFAGEVGLVVELLRGGDDRGGQEPGARSRPRALRFRGLAGARRARLQPAVETSGLLAERARPAPRRRPSRARCTGRS